MGEKVPKSREFREIEDGVSHREGVGGEPGTFKVRDRIEYEYEIPGHLYRSPEQRLPQELRMKLERGKYKFFYAIFKDYSRIKDQQLLLKSKSQQERLKSEQRIEKERDSINERIDALGMTPSDLDEIYKKVGLSLGMEFGEEVIARLKNLGL